MRSVIPRWGCLIVWGLLTGTASITIYSKVSPQERIEEVKKAAAEARVAMRRYDGNFDGLLPLVRKSLGLSIRQLALAAGPAFAASLPALFLIGYLDTAYAYIPPHAGAVVSVRVEPRDSAVKWSPHSSARGADGIWSVRWPVATDPITLSTSRGVTLARLPLRAPVPELEKFSPWNFLYGNPVGYIPNGTHIEAITVDMAPAEYIGIGPEWLRGWETLFFLAAAFSSILIKTRLQLH